ncbi:MAG TPA: lysophospholipid acyltransferase family protein [Nocardioidaceae bacterium]|nr:lysophospholipid acyltransferase family protein [Nocardioidaceae bacterium]
MTLTNEEAHERARKGPSKVAYYLTMVLLVPILRLVFSMRVSGAENIPKKGAAVIVPNHKSFWDGFFIAACTTRRVHFMGKSELFEGPQGRLLLALGGFPVRRGESDQDALDTARAILDRGDILALFPEGTRVRDEGLGTPKRGAARLAIESGAPLIPTAITGTEKRKWPLPRRVQVAFGEPVPVADLEATPDDAAKVINEDVWPTITEEYSRLKARPGVIAAGVAAVGIGAWIYKKRKG